MQKLPPLCNIQSELRGDELVVPVHFDEIHTEKKQALLQKMMSEAAGRIRHIGSSEQPLTACPICSSPVVPFVSAFGFAMSRCTHCGLIFCNPYPSEVQLDAYYNGEMKEFENEFFRDSFDKRLQLFKPRVDMILRHRPRGRLLEIGSAIGIFITALRDADAPYEITACDRSLSACTELTKRFPTIQVVKGDAGTLHTTLPFDVVAMWDTIEHVVDLKGLLTNVHRLLDDKGIFIFSTPNTKSFEWIIADAQHVQILPPGHVNLLNPTCISLLLNASGFSIVEQQTLNAQLDISYVQKLLAQGKVSPDRLGAFLPLVINDERFSLRLADYLVEARLAGNIVTVARKQ